MATFAFYFFALVAVASGLLVVFARSPVHSVLWLILAFFGAVAVLFLFVVMMLDVDFAALREGMATYLPVGLLIGVVLLVQLGFAFSSWDTSEIALAQRAAVAPAEVENTAALGMLIYTKYVFLFQAAGLVLLVAMVGAIVLTLRKRASVKRQDVLVQMYRDPKEAVRLVDVKPGQGL